MGGLYLALCPLRRADAALSQAHRHQTLSLHRLRPQLLPLWSPGTSSTAPRHDVKLFVPLPPQPSPPCPLLRRHARPSGGSKCCWRHLPSLQMWTYVLNMGGIRGGTTILVTPIGQNMAAVFCHASRSHKPPVHWWPPPPSQCLIISHYLKGLQERHIARSTAITITENDDGEGTPYCDWFF